MMRRAKAIMIISKRERLEKVVECGRVRRPPSRAWKVGGMGQWRRGWPRWRGQIEA